MIELQVSLEEHLRKCAMLHTCLCPRQVIGVRMARFACRWLGVDPALQRKQLFIYMEVGHCAADGVIAVTNASPTNNLMKLLDYGKLAATFVHLSTNRSVRVRENQSSRALAVRMMPDLPSSWEAQRQAYQIMPDEELLLWDEVKLSQPPPTIMKKYAVTCASCGDKVHEHCEVVIEGESLCKACAYGAYYALTDEVNSSLCQSA
jgi:formylmethanofuran dehydrogenase subunit E